MPVDSIAGFPVAATFRKRALSTSSNEAILYAGTPIFSRKSTAVSSKGLEKRSSPSLSVTSLSLGCHSQGV